MHTAHNILTPSALGLELHGRFGEQSWYLISSDIPSVATEDVVDALLAAEVPFQRVFAKGPEDLLRGGNRESTTCLPTNTWDWENKAYLELDYFRDRVRAAWPVLVWVTSPQGIERMIHSAPNLSAFFQPSVGIWSRGAMEQRDIETHLAALRERYALSDNAVVSLAERGELPSNADHQAWLVLLGRGDLISRNEPR